MHDRTFPALNALRAAGAIMVLLTHAAFNTGRINDGWSGRHAGPLRLRRDALLHPVRLPAQPALVPGSGARAPGASARHYLWKRALRILPLYWVVVVVAFVVDPSTTMRTGWTGSAT